jgi:hypothetical protein
MYTGGGRLIWPAASLDCMGPSTLKFTHTGVGDEAIHRGGGISRGCGGLV